MWYDLRSIPSHRAIVALPAVLAAFLITTAAIGSDTEQQVASTPTADRSGATLVFFREGEPVAVERSATELSALPTKYTAGQASRYETIVRAVVAGPSESEKLQMISNALPEGTVLGDVIVPSDKAIEIYLDLPEGYVGTTKYSPRMVEEIAEQFHKSLLDEPVRSFRFFVKDPATGEYGPIRAFLPAPKVFGPEPDNAVTDGTPPLTPAPRTAPPAPVGPVIGALSGKAVVLNQSHGWFDDNDGPSIYNWRVQRGKLWEINEDSASGEFMDIFVVPLLLNAGAKVQPVRECDLQTNMVIVDNADGSPAYVETGTWANSTADGFVKAAWPSGGSTTTNPFGTASATRFANTINGTPNATATYTPTIPAAGYYNVYISFSKSSNRTSQAHWQVHHTGGITDFRVDEKKDGATWLLLGNFYFNAGSNPATGRVVVLNDATDGSVVTCDAVRFGGGMGDVIRRNHGASGKPRWQEEACNYLSYLGCYVSGGPLYGDSTSSYDDEELGWSNRPAYASWEQSRDSEGANVVYVGWHTNAYNGGCVSGADNSGTGRGTVSYRDADGEASAGSVSLTSACHNAVINNIHAFYDSSWNDRGIVDSNSYGECNQSNLGTVSGFFFEGLFHDNDPDTQAYRDPKFRYLLARGIVQGIISHYGGTTFPPEPPTNFRVRNIGGGQVRLDWTAGPVRDGSHPYGSAATGYRVYRSTDGYGFDNGTNVTVANATFTLSPGQMVFYRVAAVNSAGVSIPCETLVVRVSATGQTPALIVNGSHRFDRYLPRLVTGVSGCADSLVRRIDWRSFQSFNYTIQHGKALEFCNVPFDSCSAECVEAGQIALTSYSFVDWIGGQEAETQTEPINVDDTAIKTNSRTAIQNYLQAGGKVFMSSSELAWDFDRASGPVQAERDFLHNYMKAAYSADDANTYQAQGSGGIFSGLGSLTFDNGTGVTYDVRFPDAVTATGGATACMTYVGGSGGIAGLQYSGNFGSSTTPGKMVYLGFGFETIMSENIRKAVMGRVVGFFGATAASSWELY